MVIKGRCIERLIPKIKIAVDRRHDGAAVTQDKRQTRGNGSLGCGVLGLHLRLQDLQLLALRRQSAFQLDKLSQDLWDHHRADLLRQRLHQTGLAC